MTRRMILLLGVATMLTLTAGGVWATLANANVKAAVGGCSCDTDPTCPPGCSPECPPDCTYCPALGLTAKAKGNVKKAVDCCDDPTCPPGCSDDCPRCCAGSTTTKAAARASKRTVDCCGDPSCPPGCSTACPPDCLGFTAKDTKAKNQTKAKTFCTPCPFCP